MKEIWGTHPIQRLTILILLIKIIIYLLKDCIISFWMQYIELLNYIFYNLIHLPLI